MNTLIDPNDVVCYTRDENELQMFWLFCLVVAGKTAKTQARLLDNFIQSLDSPYGEFNDTPMGRIHMAERQGVLLDRIKESRLGQFNRLHKAFMQSTMVNLSEATVAELETIHGVGPKTARMFVMMSRKDQRYAALDTHVLKHLRANGVEAPLSTPSGGKKYDLLEQEFLKLADASEMEVAEYDLMVWKQYSQK